MIIINQPKALRIGDLIIKNLEIQNDESKFDNLYIMVAYVRESGVSRIRRSLKQFRLHGGKVKAVVGIDEKNTTKEGLSSLMNDVDETYIYHNTNAFHTFHPKLYIFEKKSKKAIIFVGSNNLTQGGLFTNYETSIKIELNLKKPKHRERFNEIMTLFDQYSNLKSPCCKVLNASLLNQLEKRNLLGSEKLQNIQILSQHHKEKQGKLAALFGAETVPLPPKPYPRIVSAKYKLRKKGFWKKLSSFDVSKTSAPGQIIIPMEYLALFPLMTNWSQTKVGARQADVFFDVVFVDSANKKRRVKNARAVHYIPAPSHPRPNQELRFTFRNRKVFNQLHKGDILEFRRTSSYSIWFEIKLIPRKSKQTKIYLKTGKRYDKVL